MRIEGCVTNLVEPIRAPQRIVAVGPSNTEILHALGLGLRIVGVDRWSDYPPRVQRLPRVGSDLRVDVDTVHTLHPDIVVASLHVPGMEDNLAAFERVGLRYLGVGGVGLDGIWQDIRYIGEWLCRSGRAETLVQRMQAAIYGTAPDARRRLKVHWEWSAHPVVAGGRSWITELLEAVGAENAYADLDVESTRVALAEVVERQPDLVVACWCGVRRLPSVALVLNRPAWRQQVRAFATARVAVLSEAYFGRPGPRLAEGARQLRELLAAIPA